MSRFLRLLLAPTILLLASLGGCLVSAQTGAVMDEPESSIFQHASFDNVVMMFGGIGLAIVSLSFYAVHLRRSAARLRIDHAADQLLIDALDQMRAPIVIFDSDMQAVHWNSGFEGQFPQLVPLLKEGATLQRALRYGRQNDVFATDPASGAAQDLTDSTVQRLKGRDIVQQIMQTSSGNIFDLRIFPSGDRHYGAIWVDVTDAHRQQACIIAQSRALELKNQQLLAFSTMVAHDLRAPLIQQSALIGFLHEDIRAAGLDLPAQIGPLIVALGDLSRRMTVLVGDLLDYAHADSDQAPPEIFRPDTRLQDVVALAATGPDMEVVIMPDMPAVMVEPKSFDMVMRNLVANAAKHHDRTCGCITLRAYRTRALVVVEIEDDGPGIAPSHRDRVFDPFTRLTHVQGTGLGLALVRKAVLAWGGTVQLRAAPRRGCIFSVSMPAAPVATRTRNLSLEIAPEALQG
jgi:signal transduction histidine kinase